MSYKDIMFINRKFILWVLMFGGVVDTIKSTPTRLTHNTPGPIIDQFRSDGAAGPGEPNSPDLKWNQMDMYCGAIESLIERNRCEFLRAHAKPWPVERR